MKSSSNKNVEEIVSNLTDTFALKNYILTDTVKMTEGISLEDPFIFDGAVFAIGLKGSATIKINHKGYLLAKDMIITIMPGQIFKVENKSDDFLVETLWVSSDFVYELPFPKGFDILKNITEHPCLKIAVDTKNDLLELHSLVTKYHHYTDKHYRERMVRALIYTLLLGIASEYSCNTSNDLIKKATRQEELTRHFFELLLQHYIDERSVAFYAGKLCLTPKYLSMSIKAVTEHSISDWINLAVIIEAKKRLKITEHTILQISEELNFPNPSFFGRFFKQYAGKTPLQYRNG